MPHSNRLKARSRRIDARSIKASRHKEHWVNVVWIVAAGISCAAMALFALAIGLGWYGLIAGPPMFVAVSVLLLFFLGVADRKREMKAKRERSKPRRRLTRQPAATLAKKIASEPTPAVAKAMKASSAESAGRAPLGHSPLPLLRRGGDGALPDTSTKSARV